MNNDDNDGIKRYRHRQLVWLGIYMGIGLAIVFLLPFPIDLILVIGTMVGMNFIRKKMVDGKHLGGKNIGGLFGSFPSSMTGNPLESCAAPPKISTYRHCSAIYNLSHSLHS